ncbi:serine/threonine-protein kinase [Streptomyces scabiei]|uniref:serine/threonine-protein kinase n=1 Tax=Streptomyces scabiei TaxID=1930 RepID=UPI00277D0AF7|nr:serine/threonine-protein kinase [Streptomyces scabiei]
MTQGRGTGRLITGRYELSTLIGQGGMGQVWTAYDQRLDRRVAVKLLRPDKVAGQEADELRRRFVRECRVTAQVDHPGLVTVHDAGSEDEELFLVMQYVDGADLADHLAEHDPYPWQWAVSVAAQLCAVLSAVHAVPIIHRDLKPSNILLGSQGPFVIDFGIARAADATHLTQSGGLIGTPQYMSPEHALGEQVTPATDVFSLGLIAAVAATGRHPYGDGGAITIAAQIANTAQRPPRLDGYDERLRPLLERCLTADPAARAGTEELAALCQESAGRGLGDFTGWLPAPLTAEIARREQSVQSPPQPTAPEMPAAPPAAPPTTAPAAQGTAPGTTQGAPQPGQATGFGPPPQTQPPGYGYPPPATDTYHLTPQPGAGQAPAPAKKSRRGLKAALVALALVLVAGSGAAAAVYVLNGKDKDGTEASDTKGSGKGDGTGKDKGTPAPAPTDDGSGGGAGQDVADPSESATVSADTKFTLAFENQSFVLRTPAENYTYIDLDRPSIDIKAEMRDEAREMSIQNGQWSFETTMGKSKGRTLQQCRTGADTDALPSLVGPDDFGKDGIIPEGSLLCTVTKDGNLALYEITKLTPGEYSWEVPSVEGKLTLWKKSGE